MLEKIRPIVSSVTSVSEGSLKKINELVEYISVKKGETITSVGEKNNLEYFMIEGICKSFLSTPNGDSVTISFFMSNSIVSPSTTRNNAGKSVVNIQVLTDGEIATLNAEAFEKLMIEDLEIREFGNSILRNEFMEKVQKGIALASLRGKDRLIQLRKNYPNIENCIPHANIASYLGLTTFALSRLRTLS